MSSAILPDLGQQEAAEAEDGAAFPFSPAAYLYSSGSQRLFVSPGTLGGQGTHEMWDKHPFTKVFQATGVWGLCGNSSVAG